jgi:hypothetical protein
MREAGPLPELMNNMAVGLMYLGRREDAKAMMMKVLAADPGQATALGLGTREGEWIPKKIFQVDIPGLRSMAPVTFAAHGRTPLASRDKTEVSRAKA